MRPFELSGKLVKRHSLACPADLEQTQHDLALALLDDFDREFPDGPFFVERDSAFKSRPKTAIRELAIKIIKQRESEIVLGLFKVGWAGERMTFDQLSLSSNGLISPASPKTP